MNTYSAQNSITVKRLRNGDTFFITFGNNGIPLFQGVDPVTGVVTPDWTVAANQPVVTPVVTSARGNAVVLSNHQWSYNGVALNFNGATSGDWTTDSTGKFQLNSSTGALKIIANLASTTNIASDSLTYSCVATVAGVEYNLTNMAFSVFGMTMLFVKDYTDEFTNIRFFYNRNVVIRWTAYVFVLSSILLAGVFGADQFIYSNF